MKTYVITAALACAAALIVLLLRNPSALKRLGLSAVGGLAAFGAVNLTGMVTGISLVPNLATLGTAVVMGIPGVVGLMFLKLIFRI